MKRRDVLRAGCACLAALPAAALGDDRWQPPPRFARPDPGSDEGGLWALMDRAENRLRHSPFLLREPALQAQVESIACRLAAAHCPDIRVYLVRAPNFNASMAPNGMMQVWSGLMLRVDNEAQLAAVLGHEIGHYLQRHGVEAMRDASSRAALASFAGLVGGGAGALAGLGVMAGRFGFSRDNEREADRVGARLMHAAGYDVGEAARIWGSLLVEVQARREGAKASALFATHPPEQEREAALGELAAAYPGGERNEDGWQRGVAPHLRQWLDDELKRGQHEESIAFLTRALRRSTGQAEYLYARGEVYRLRARESDGDLRSALDDFMAAIAAGGEPPQTYRGLGMIYRARRQPDEARASFERYLELAPGAPDAPMMRNYLEELPA